MGMLWYLSLSQNWMLFVLACAMSAHCYSTTGIIRQVQTDLHSNRRHVYACTHTHIYLYIYMQPPAVVKGQ